MKQWLLPGPQSRMFRAGGGGCLPATAANACPASTGIPGAQDPDRPELSSLEGLVPLWGIHHRILSLMIPSRHIWWSLVILRPLSLWHRPICATISLTWGLDKYLFSKEPWLRGADTSLQHDFWPSHTVPDKGLWSKAWAIQRDFQTPLMRKLESKLTRCQGFIFFHKKKNKNKKQLPTFPHSLHFLSSFECLFTYISESKTVIRWLGGKSKHQPVFPGSQLIENTPKLIQPKNFCSHGPSFVLYKRLLSRLGDTRVCKSMGNTQLQCSVNSSIGKGKKWISKIL